jgi:hypothetical protein
VEVPYRQVLLDPLATAPYADLSGTWAPPPVDMGIDFSPLQLSGSPGGTYSGTFVRFPNSPASAPNKREYSFTVTQTDRYHFDGTLITKHTADGTIEQDSIVMRYDPWGTNNHYEYLEILVGPSGGGPAFKQGPFDSPPR